jgi:hypothetical protein
MQPAPFAERRFADRRAVLHYTDPTPGEMMRSRCCMAAVLCVICLAACAGETGGNRRDTMTQRQRDSVLGQSGIPGAQGVTKALTASDSVKARNAQIDSASRP